MNVILKYFFENENMELLVKANDLFCRKGMDSDIKEGYVFAEKETLYSSDEPVEEVYLKIAQEDYKELLEILNAEYSMSGVIDTSDMSGECMNFLLDSHEKKISAKASDWYIETAMDEYEGYEDFCDDFFECSLEEYERIKDREYAYILETAGGEFLSAEVPFFEIDLEEYI